MYSLEQANQLLEYAAAVIKNSLDQSPYHTPDDPAFQEKRGIFVSLHKDGELRGCIGYILPYKSIVDSVREMALAAAFRDPRFPPLSIREFPAIRIEISILSEMQKVNNTTNIVIGRDGLYIDHPEGSGLLLPQVALEWKSDVATFLKHLCRKAGLPDGAYKELDAKLYRFGAEIFASNETR